MHKIAYQSHSGAFAVPRRQGERGDQGALEWSVCNVRSAGLGNPRMAPGQEEEINNVHQLRRFVQTGTLCCA